jgi:hypothetical protein
MNGSHEGKGLLVVFPHRYLDSHPTMLQVLEALVQKWAYVDIMSPRGECRITAGASVAEADFAFRRWSGNPFEKFNRFGRLCKSIATWRLKKQHWRYAAVIGVDPDGLGEAHALSREMGVPLVYLSFEILFRDEVTGEVESTMKAREVEASRDVKLVLVQDELRAGLLRQENDFQGAKFCLVPVAPQPIEVPRSDFLRRSLGVAIDTKLVLLAGTLLPFNSRDLLEEMVSFWPEKYRLVVHCRFPPYPREQKLLDRLTRTGRVSVSANPLASAQMPELYVSADFCLLPYSLDPTVWQSWKNVENMGLSSGKAAYAAMCGRPMVASEMPTYRELFGKFDCGATYRRLAEIPDILDTLSRNYSHHCREARRCYDEAMNPVSGIRDFCRAFDELVSAS